MILTMVKDIEIKLGGPTLRELDPVQFWDKILHDTWSHNEYFEIMCKLLWKEYPIERHESSVWADPIVKSEDEMREIIKELEGYWKSHIKDWIMTSLERKEEQVQEKEKTIQLFRALSRLYNATTLSDAEANAEAFSALGDVSMDFRNEMVQHIWVIPEDVAEDNQQRIDWEPSN
tara:strand:- start:1798 stop:2322 length:525 start_codon:yes stop_codon:yes gene_type:complete